MGGLFFKKNLNIFKNENSHLKEENSKLIEEKDNIAVAKNVELKKAMDDLKNSQTILSNQKHEIETLKSICNKLKLERVTSLNNFTQYKTKMEKNAALHENNILSYINLIRRKEKEIEALMKQMNPSKD